MTKEWVRKIFDYDKDGFLIWREPPCGWIKSGEIAGSLRKDGYRSVCIDQKSFLVHRLIYLWNFGYIPDLVDHIDRDPRNNRIENLQAANKRVNSLNRGPQINNKSGKSGVSWDNTNNKWTVRWREAKGKYLFLGYFVSLEEAIQVRLNKEEEERLKNNFEMKPYNEETDK